jgi:hypothetical protein
MYPAFTLGESWIGQKNWIEVSGLFGQIFQYSSHRSQTKPEAINPEMLIGSMPPVSRQAVAH